MKKNSMAIAFFLLPSCTLPSCPPYISYPAEVTTVANSPCVTVPYDKNEAVAFIHISEAGNNKNFLRKSFEREGIHYKLLPGECAPNYNYMFESGKTYHYTVMLFISEKEFRRFSVSFSISEQNGNRIVLRK